MSKKLETKLKPSSGSGNSTPPDMHLPTRSQVDKAFETMSEKSGREKLVEARRFERVFKVLYLGSAFALFLIFFVGMTTLERC